MTAVHQGPSVCQALCSAPTLVLTATSTVSQSTEWETEAQENEATPCWEVGLISKSMLSMKQCYFPHKRAYPL